jgi:hypothetical protein
MSSEDQDRSSPLMVEGSKLSWEIANIRSELNKHATGFEQVGRKLNEYPEQVVLDKGHVSVQGRPSNFTCPEKLFDIRSVCELTDELRTKIKRFVEVREQLRKTAH